MAFPVSTFPNLLETIARCCPEAIVVNDRRGNILFFNESAESIFGYGAAEVIGKLSVTALYPPAGARDVMVAFHAEESGGRGRLVDYETEIVRKDGRRVPIRLSCAPLLEEGQEVGTIGFFTDNSARRALEEELRALSVTDPLTHLYNRRHFLVVVEKEHARSLRTRSPYSLLMIDIDRFKSYNDTHGHDEGDAVIRAVADVMRGVMRASDTGFRYGGEEFAAVLPDTDIQGAMAVAERIRYRFSDRRFETAAGKEEAMSLSAGLVESRTGTSVAEVVRFADDALYAAKNAGRNRCISYEQLMARSLVEPTRE